MRFWDSSAIVPLLVVEAHSDAVDALYADDRDLAVWWATEIECASAIARRERHGARDTDAAVELLEELRRHWHEVETTQTVRRTARRLVRLHPLRAADALQLAAAIDAADDDPSSLPFVTLDDVLADAARREGFPVVVF